MNADSEREQPSPLRKRAERMLRARAGEEKLSAAEARRLVHGLRVHELELEMQNEELRRAQEELEASRSKYSDLYDFAPVGYLTLDEKGRVLEANLTACAQLGVERNYLIEKPLYVHVAADEGSRFFRHLKTVFEDETRQSIELRLKTARGDEFHGMLNSVLRRDASDRALCRTSFMDVTKRRQAEKRLRESEDKYRALFQGARDGIVLIDVETGTIVECNREFVEQTGREFAHLQGMKIWELRPPGNVEAAREKFLEIKEKGAGDPVQLDFQRPDGRIVPIEFVSRRVKIGGTKYLLSMSRDITRRRQAEERLRESEEKYRALFTKMLDGFAYQRIILDKDGRPVDSMFLEVNDAFERHTGLKREDVLGKKLTEVLTGPRETGFDWIGELGKVALTGNELRTEQYSEPLGRWYAVSAYSPERGYVNVVFEDVTERKEAEERLKVLLKEKEILLKELNHRVKNNMHVVSGLLALQSAALSDEQALRMFSETQDRIRSISLVHERLQQSEDLSHVNLGDYVEDLTDALMMSHGVNPDTVSLALDVDHVSVSIDTAVPCGLIINELLSNSLKYAFPEGQKGEIRISLHRAGEGRMELVASDDGVGLPEGLDPGGAKTLGLKLVRQLAENQLRGSMELTRGKGATCRVSFVDPHVDAEGTSHREENSHH